MRTVVPSIYSLWNKCPWVIHHGTVAVETFTMDQLILGHSLGNSCSWAIPYGTVAVGPFIREQFLLGQSKNLYVEPKMPNQTVQRTYLIPIYLHGISPPCISRFVKWLQHKKLHLSLSRRLIKPMTTILTSEALKHSSVPPNAQVAAHRIIPF